MAKTEVVLLPEEDGSVGKVAVQTDNGFVVLENPFEATNSVGGARPISPIVASREIIADRFGELLRFQAETGFGDGGDLRSMFDLGDAGGVDDQQPDNDAAPFSDTQRGDGSPGEAPAALQEGFFDDDLDEDLDGEVGDDEDEGEEEELEEEFDLAAEDGERGGRGRRFEDEIEGLVDAAFGPRFRGRREEDDDDEDSDFFGDDDDEIDFDDLLNAGGGGDRLSGGIGNDTLNGGAGGDTLIGGAGGDLINGGDGLDTADFKGSPGGVTINLSTGTAAGGDAQNDTLNSIENLIGSNFVDNLTGDAGPNVFDGQGGSDVLDGQGGSDSLVFPDANVGVVVDLGAGTASDGLGGNDVFTNFENVGGSSLGDQITGSADDNLLAGGDGNDTINAGAGDDVVEGGGDDDSLSGGAGDDSVSGNGGDDTIGGGDGDDTLEGGGGIDFLDFSFTTASVTIDLQAETATGADIDTDEVSGFEQVTTGSGDDSISTDNEDDTIDGGGGDDTLNGRDGDDVLTGGAGNDLFFVNDTEGSDRITDFTAGAGVADVIDVRAVFVLTNFAAVTANATDDGSDTTISFTNGESLILTGVLVADLVDDDFRFPDVITGTAAADILNGTGAGERIEGLADDDELSGLGGNDTIDGGSGDDTLNGGDDDDLLIGGAGADEFDGGDGNDTVSFVTATAAIAIAFSATDGSGIGGVFTNQPNAVGLAGDALNDSFSDVDNIEAFVGSGFDDTVGGSATDMSFDLGAGNDVFDTNAALASDATVDGGAGNDLVFSGTGNDELIGGDGNDSLRGEQDDDEIEGNAGDDDLNGGSGDDEIRGGAGADTLIGGSGEDELTGNSGNDRLDGGANDDELDGSGGADTLIGGGGDDELIGGTGADRLTGGPGGDVFVWEGIADGLVIAANRTINGGDAVDVIVDFGPGDRIELDDGEFVNLPITALGFAYDGTNSAVVAGPALIFDGNHLIFDPNVNSAGYVAIAEVNGAPVLNTDLIFS